MSSFRWGSIIFACTCIFQTVWLASAVAEEPVLLKYKLAKDEILIYKKTDDMRQDQSLMDQKFATVIKHEQVLSRVVDGIGPEGKLTLKSKVDQRRFSIDSLVTGKYEFDSKSTERDTASLAGMELTPVFERVTGTEYQLVMDPRGRILEVKGYSELLADVIKDKPLAAQLAGDNSSTLLTEQDFFVVLSDKPVKVGDKWESPIDVELPKVGRMKGRTTYVYEGPDQVAGRKTARIGATSELAFDLQLDLGGVKAAGTLTSTNSTGTIQFDPAAGRVVSAKRNLAMSGEFSAEFDGMNVTVRIDQKQAIVIELLDKVP